MRRLPLLCTLVFAIALAAPALAAPARAPRLVRITFGPTVSLQTLREVGLDVVNVKGTQWADVLDWPGDEERFARLGVPVELLDADPGRTMLERAEAELGAGAGRRTHEGTRINGGTRGQTAPPVGGGSLGGFWTLDEVKMKLDDLVANDVNDVVADRIDTLGYTLQGRPVWGLRLGKTVVGPDTRPVAFFNALTHAREPGGMQALLYFVDNLLGRYGADPIATTLLERRRIYIVPVVNPDGYRFNQRLRDSLGSFGMWRKNLRDNDADGVTDPGEGVDINRNYGEKWGFNNVGSSGTPTSDVYRGSSAFSEPETRIQRDIVTLLQPRVGLSFHTFSDLLVHPWGWTTQGTNDSLKFQEWSDELSLENGYTAGPGPRILYEVNGEFNDWAYGDTLTKPRAFTWTPEVGSPSDNFWPAPSRIVPLAIENLRACYTVAEIAGPWVKAERTTIVEGALNAGNLAHLAIRARNIGSLGSAGPGLTAQLTAIDPEVEELSGPIPYPTLGSLQSGDADAGGTFLVAAVDTITPGRKVRFRVDFTAPDGFFSRDTIEIVVGTPTVVLNEPSNNFVNWNIGGGSWGSVANDPNHPSRYFADSPFGRYQGSLTNPILLKNPLNLSQGVHAWLFFENKWQFESDYDTAVLEASRNNSTWTTLASRGTTASNSTSLVGTGRQVFDGTRWLWRADRVDLSGFAGGTASDSVWLRLRVLSDAGFELDGFAFDSMRVVVYDPAAQPAPVAVDRSASTSRLEFAAPWPNPARGLVRFEFALPREGRVRLEVLDVQGRRVALLANGVLAAARYVRGWDLRDDAGRAAAPGVYLARLSGDVGDAVRRIVVLP